MAEEGTAITQSGDADATSEYIAVTLLVASRNKIAMKGVDSADQLRTALSALGAVPASELLALEVIWQPDGAGDVLSANSSLAGTAPRALRAVRSWSAESTPLMAILLRLATSRVTAMYSLVASASPL